MKSPKLHRILSLTLALCMLCTVLPGVSLTAFADDTYTVTFSTPTGIVPPAAVEVVAGRSFAVPTGIASPDPDYTFVGWYANPISNEITLQNENSIYTELYTPTADITLFACYKRTETLPAYYQKSTGEPASSANKYLIVYEGADKSIAFNGGLGTAASHFNVSGNYIEVTVANVNGTDQIAYSATVEAAAVTIRRIATGQFSIELPCGKYFGINSASSTNIKLYDTAYANHLDFDALGYVLISDTSNTSGRDFTYSTRYDKFAFYKDGSNLHLYKKESARTVNYYTTNPLGEPPCAHQNTTLTGAVEATCTTDGHTGTCVCDDCGATLQTDSVIPALGHNYDSGVQTTAPSCTAAGVKTYTCSRCNDTYTEPIAALGHNYGAFVSNSNGTHSKTCSRCSDVVTENCTYTSSTSGNITTYTCSVCGYSYQEQNGSTTCTHNFVNNECTLCGEMFRIRSATLSLNNQIDVVYICEIPTGFTNVTLTVNGTAITEYQESNGKYYFFYTGVTPQCMGDNLSATLTGTYNGQTFTAIKDNYSVRQYCINKLNDASISESFRSLISALLYYGSYAQYYMGYKTDNYVMSNVDIIKPQFSELSGYSASFDGDAAEDTYWISAGLLLTNGVGMVFRFYAESSNGLIVYVTINGVTKTYTADDFSAVVDEPNVYEIVFDEISPDEFADTITAVFEMDDNQVGNSLLYSVNAYIQSKQNDSNKKLKNLVRALSCYGISVENYISE